jgi:hypothetical protein
MARVCILRQPGNTLRVIFVPVDSHGPSFPARDFSGWAALSPFLLRSLQLSAAVVAGAEAALNRNVTAVVAETTLNDETEWHAILDRHTQDRLRHRESAGTVMSFAECSSGVAALDRVKRGGA